MRKSTCKIDGCERHCFAYEDVCLPHFRMLHMTDGDSVAVQPASPPPPGEQASAAPPIPPTVPAEPPAPTISSRKDAWVEWAVARPGVDRATADKVSKAQLIRLCREGALES